MQGDFYFIKNEFFIKTADKKLLTNKITGGRPCFFALKDTQEKDIYWLVPITSKTKKYEDIYNKNIEKYNKCDFLEFGTVLGTKAVFLIQNLFPISNKYIDMRYEINGNPVKTDNVTTKNVIDKVKTVLEKKKKGIKLYFTDIDGIYQFLKTEQNSVSSEVATMQTATSVGQQQNPAPTNVQKAVDNVALVEIEPLDIYKNVRGGGVIVRLSGKNPEDAKTQVLLQKNEFLLDKYNKVCSVSASAQARFGIPLKNNTIKKLTT